MNDTDWEDDREHETESIGAYKYGALEYENDREYQHREWESKTETEEYEDRVLAGGEYEHEELECEGGETYEHEELMYRPEHRDAEQEYEHGIYECERLKTRNNKVYELRELEYKPKHSDSDAHYGILEPQMLKSRGYPSTQNPSARSTLPNPTCHTQPHAPIPCQHETNEVT